MSGICSPGQGYILIRLGTLVSHAEAAAGEWKSPRLVRELNVARLVRAEELIKRIRVAIDSIEDSAASAMAGNAIAGPVTREDEAAAELGPVNYPGERIES